METKQLIKFVQYKHNGHPQTKFGGQPDWLEEPQWPISAALGEQMRFIGQIHLGDVLPEHAGKIAYMFMTESDATYVDGTWSPDDGENAVIIQPQGRTDVPVEATRTGPSREEFGVEIVEQEIDEDDLEGCRLGGTPEFMQGEEYPGPKKEWRFLAQLDSCALPFEINFGDAGIGYAFINQSGSRGKFLWQCG